MPRAGLKRTVGILVLTQALSGCWMQGLAPTIHLEFPRRRTPSLLRSLSGARRLTHFPRTLAHPRQYFRFTAREQEQLTDSRCRFDSSGLTAERLAQRGFSSAEVVQACRDIRRYAHGDRRAIEAIAAWRRAGLPLGEFADAHGSGMSLSTYFNEVKLGGAGLSRVGWTFTGIGLGHLLLAGLIWAVYGIRAAWRETHPSTDPWDTDVESMVSQPLTIGTSITAGVLGAIFLVSGLPMVFLGESRRAHWVQGELLDVGHVRDLDRFRQTYSESPRLRSVSLGLAPFLTRGGAGLTMSLRF